MATLRSHGFTYGTELTELVPQVGWSDFFAITALSALLGLLLVLVLRRAIDRVELARPH